jgi:hypothetical protein
VSFFVSVMIIGGILATQDGMRHGGGCLAGAGLGNCYNNFTVPETERYGGHLDRRYVHLFSVYSCIACPRDCQYVLAVAEIFSSGPSILAMKLRSYRSRGASATWSALMRLV